MVAPNSPSALAKHSTMPAMMPGSASGSVTVSEQPASRLAPSVAAASSSRRSIASIDSRIGAHQQRKAHDAAGERGAGPAEREHDAEMSASNAPIGAAAAERDQQQIAGDHRRQHQRQMHDAVEQRLAPEILARQQPARSAMPNGSATTVATIAIRSDRTIAVHSSGVRENISRYSTRRLVLSRHPEV